MVVRHHHRVLGAREVAAAQRVFGRTPDHAGAGEAFGIRPLGPLVDHRDAEAATDRQRRERLSDVTGAEDQEPGGGLDHLHEHAHLAAAAHSQVPGQMALHHPASASRLQQLPGGGQRLVLDRAPADGAAGLAPARHQHARPRLPRREAARFDHGQQREHPALRPPRGERLPHAPVVAGGEGVETAHAPPPAASRTARRTYTGTIWCR